MKLSLFSKYSYELISNPTLTIDQEPGSFENSCLSENIHEQAKSSLCWAFAIATMIRSALKYFFRKNKKNMTHDVIDKVNDKQIYISSLDHFVADKKLCPVINSGTHCMVIDRIEDQQGNILNSSDYFDWFSSIYICKNSYNDQKEVKVGPSEISSAFSY